MSERLVTRRQLIRGSLSVLGFSMFTGCVFQGPSSNERIVHINQPQSASADVLQGDGFEIRRIGDEVFSLSGERQDRAVGYIASRCEVLSVGPWKLADSHYSIIIERVVVVKDGKCIPELSSANEVTD